MERSSCASTCSISSGTGLRIEPHTCWNKTYSFLKIFPDALFQSSGCPGTASTHSGAPGAGQALC